jgi:hypothetical protein
MNVKRDSIEFVAWVIGDWNVTGRGDLLRTLLSRSNHQSPGLRSGQQSTTDVEALGR